MTNGLRVAVDAQRPGHRLDQPDHLLGERRADFFGRNLLVEAGAAQRLGNLAGDADAHVARYQQLFEFDQRLVVEPAAVEDRVDALVEPRAELAPDPRAQRLEPASLGRCASRKAFGCRSAVVLDPARSRLAPAARSDRVLRSSSRRLGVRRAVSCLFFDRSGDTSVVSRPPASVRPGHCGARTSFDRHSDKAARDRCRQAAYAAPTLRQPEPMKSRPWRKRWRGPDPRTLDQDLGLAADPRLSSAASAASPACPQPRRPLLDDSIGNRRHASRRGARAGGCRETHGQRRARIPQ